MAGNYQEFGTVGISRDGLHVEGNTLGWADVKQVLIKEHGVAIKRRTGLQLWHVIAPSSFKIGFPNLHLFMALVRTAQQNMKEQFEA